MTKQINALYYAALRLIAGFEQPDSGQIELRGRDMTAAAPGERNLGYVPQSFALYPHFSVFDNIAYPLALIRAPKTEIKAAVQRAAELLKIEALLERKPEQLSGGQKQRVAIARGDCARLGQEDRFVYLG